MKSLTKRVGVSIVAFAIIATLLIGSGLIIDGLVFAADNVDHAYKYFYNQLIEDSMEQRFYDAFENLANTGEFKKGTIRYDLVANSVVTKDEATAYVNGSTRMAEAFSAGRDAFYMDHPDLFYVDLFSMSISAGQNATGVSVAYLDSSRVLNTYRGNLNSEDAVNGAITAYETKLSEIVTEANKKADVKSKIEYVNEYIATNVKYGFGTVVQGDRNVDTDKAPFIYTSYGALVNGESVCEGYAKSFKAVMDRLEIPCVCIQGYADGTNDDTYEPHMWNYVRVEGQWYMVDPTYNAGFGENTHKYDSWLLCGGEKMQQTHMEDGVVSTSGYELKYPALKPYDYGVDTDSNGMSIIGEYLNDNLQLDLHISYNDMGALKLQDENKYLAFRYGSANDEGGITWGNWYNVIVYNQAAMETYDMAELPYLITDTETVIRNVAGEYVQLALMNSAPTVSEKLLPFDTAKEYVVAYDPATIEDITPSAPYHNEAFKSINPPPFGFGYPSNTGEWPYDKTYDIRLTYTDELKLLDPSLPAGIEFNTSVSDDIAHEKAILENFHWEEGSNTVTFTFTPSRMYIHSSAIYYFTLVNLVGKKSNKIPNPVSYSFKGKSVVCSKVFNDGRLYMNVFGSPKLLDDSNLSVTDFKDENGKYYAESQRSQLMLVATKTAETAQMNTLLEDQMKVQSDDVVASSTYEIDLHVCGMVHQIPNGSFMQVSFGFPEGYDADDAGTTFKIYHYTHDDRGNITGVEEIPVIVTEYGLIAQVRSFSPFTIVQLKNTSAAVDDTANRSKRLYTNIIGNNGGSVSIVNLSDISGQIVGLDADSTPLAITADQGYAIGSVMLNGKLVSPDDYKDGTLTLYKDSLSADNMLEVTFVSEESYNYYKQEGVTLAYGGTLSNPIVVPGGDPVIDDPSDPQGPNVAGIVIGVLVGVLVLCGGGFAIWWFFIKNKKQPAEEVANDKPVKSSKTTTKKSVANKSTATKAKAGGTKTANKTSSTSKTTNSKKK